MLVAYEPLAEPESLEAEPEDRLVAQPEVTFEGPSETAPKEESEILFVKAFLYLVSPFLEERQTFHNLVSLWLKAIVDSTVVDLPAGRLLPHRMTL